MRNAWAALLLAAALAASANVPPSADHAYRPPGVAESRGVDLKELLPQHAIRKMLTGVENSHVFRVFEGQNNELAAFYDDAKLYMVAEGFPVGMASADLFGAPFQDGPAHVYLAEIASVDALALRLSVDLSGLAAGDEVWVLDTVNGVGYGPFGPSDYVCGGRMLPMTEGDRTVLMARTPSETPPALNLVEVSHFFRTGLELKLLACNINIACEPDAAIREEIASAVAMIYIPMPGGGTAICTACLIDNPDTTEVEERYLLTANHCLSTHTSAAGIEVYWDYRAATCDALIGPELIGLPSAYGSELLATSSALDATLLRLHTVPTGVFGRTHLGWDTREPSIDQDVIAIHHPTGSHMRISYGAVTGIDVNIPDFRYVHQTEVLWEDGVTEPGSSGCPLLALFAGEGYRVVGMLSGGTIHQCDDTSNNYDWFASFRDFFPSVESYLEGIHPPPASPGNVRASNGTFSTKVQVTWDAVADAAEYRVYRNAANNPAAAMAVSTWQSETTFDDVTAMAPELGWQGCAMNYTYYDYYYWVRSRSDYGESGFSLADIGYRGEPQMLTKSTSDGMTAASTRAAASRALPIALMGLMLLVHRSRRRTNH